MRKFLWIVVLCVLAAGAWVYFHSKSNDDSGGEQGKSSGSGANHKGGGKNMTVPVGTAMATNGNISVYLEGLGNITPRQTVTVHSLITGQLMSLGFAEGQMVKKNDVLALIDDRPYVAVLEQAQGLLTRDQALLAEAKIDLARYQQLWKQDSIARQQLDTQTSLVKQYEGAIKNDQGQVDAARTNLIYTRITSPVTGRVGLRQVDEGNIVHTTDTNGIVIVTELQPITSLFTIPEDNIPAVMKHVNGGDKLEADAWDRDNKNKLATGVLTAVDNEVDPTTGTVKFRAEFANEDNTLFPSQFVNIRLKLYTLNNAVTIPASAVQRGTNGTFIYKVVDTPPADSGNDKPVSDKDTPKDSNEKDGGVKKAAKYVAVQNIALGPADGERVSVTKGVTVGDQMVVDGADTLRDGAKIEIAAIDGKSTKSPDKGEKSDGSAAGKDSPDASHHHHKTHSDDGDNAK